MNNKTLLTTIALTVMTMSAPALATDMEKTSYTHKKMGMVHFKSKKSDTQEQAAHTETDYNDPSKIEPAAGDTETTTVKEDKNSLKESIQLPRKQ